MGQELFKTECLKFRDTRKIIAVQENGRKYEGTNTENKEFTLYKVDACLIIDGSKCDYLLLDCDEKRAYFIELKGADLVQAIRQINASLDELLPTLQQNNYTTIHARIVLSKANAPDIQHSELIKLRKRLRSFEGTIEYKATLLKEKI